MVSITQTALLFLLFTFCFNLFFKPTSEKIHAIVFTQCEKKIFFFTEYEYIKSKCPHVSLSANE